MTQAEFKQLPYLLLRHQVVACGYGRAQLDKFVDCGVLRRVQLTGLEQHRYQKKQLAELLGWGELLEAADFLAEPPLLAVKAAQRWTGLSDTVLAQVRSAGGLTFVKPPGAGNGKFLKREIAGLIGFEKFI
jgi:hypothetical protein